MTETETLAKLRALTRPALSAAEHQLRTTGQVTPTFVLEYPSGELRELVLPGDMGGIMNSQQAKDILFGLVRAAVHQNNIQAVLFVSDAWVGRNADPHMTTEQFDRLTKSYNGDVRAMAAAGLVRMWEAITITAQTASFGLVTQQLYERPVPDSPNVVLGKIEEKYFPSSTVSGRIRLFATEEA